MKRISGAITWMLFITLQIIGITFCVLEKILNQNFSLSIILMFGSSLVLGVCLLINEVLRLEDGGVLIINDLGDTNDERYTLIINKELEELESLSFFKIRVQHKNDR